MLRFASRVLVSISTLGCALGQGSDACATAQSITGTGSFAFDNSLATTDGSGDPLCISGAAQLDPG